VFGKNATETFSTLFHFAFFKIAISFFRVTHNILLAQNYWAWILRMTCGGYTISYELSGARFFFLKSH